MFTKEDKRVREELYKCDTIGQQVDRAFELGASRAVIQELFETCEHTREVVFDRLCKKAGIK